MSFSRFFAALVLVSAVAGCDGDGNTLPLDSNGDISARMVGDMPEVSAFDDNTKTGSFYAYDNYVSLDMHVLGEFGWAMLMVSGELDGDRLMNAEVIGCSGPEEYNAVFDDTATDSDVLLERTEVDGEDVFEITIDATFEGSDAVFATGVAALQ